MEIERDRQRERECRKSSRKGVKEHSVRKLQALNTNICGYRWTGEHVCTHANTNGGEWRARCHGVSLSFVNRQLVSSEK